MTKLKRQWVVGCVGAALIMAMTAFPSRAEACHGHMMHGGEGYGEQEGHGGHYLTHLLKHAKEIGLTPEQIGKLKALQLDAGRTHVRLDADVRIAKLELDAALEDEHAAITAIQGKVDQLKKAEAALMIAGIKGKRDAEAVLTPDQREKDRAVHEQMKSGAQHGGGMGGMMGGMGGGMMGGSGHGQGSGDHGSGGSGGAQQHQH